MHDSGRPIDNVFAIIGGMGPEAAKVATQRAIEDYGARRLVNAGICGALRTGRAWVPGAVFVINQAIAIDLTTLAPTGAVDCDGQAWDCLPTANLVTCDRPLFDSGLRDELASWGALVDMEGAAVAAVARDKGRPCTLIKGITDFAAEGERIELHRRLANVSRQIAEVLVAGLHQPKPKLRDTHCPPY